MLMEIDLAQLSGPCIGEIAKQTTSAEALAYIAEYAMGDGHYADDHEEYPDETYFYMDEVVMNEALSDETLNKLIMYNKSRDMHMCILEERSLSPEQVDLFIKSVNDLSLFEYLINEQNPELSKEQYDTIAKRIMSEDICVRDCYDHFYSYERDSVDEEIHRIAEHCTDQIANDLLGWWSVTIKVLFDYDVKFDVVILRLNEECTNYNTAHMATDFADTVANGIMRGTMKIMNCTDCESDEERSFDDTILAITRKCSRNVSVSLNIWRCDYKKHAARKTNN